MRAGVRHYVRSGYGGSGTAARRFGGTVQRAGSLFNVLAPGGGSTPSGAAVTLDRELLQSRSAQEIVTAVIEAVQPVDGTQDAEAARLALGDALGELLDRFPNADLLNLTDDEREFVIERYAASDVFRRFQLDIGAAVFAKAPNATAAVQRLKQIREYIREVIAASFKKQKDGGATLTANRIRETVSAALRDAMEVFEIEPV